MRTLSAALQTAQAATERVLLTKLTIEDERMDFNNDEGSATEYDGNLPVNDNPAMTWATALIGDSCMDGSGDIHQAIVRETGGSFYVYYRKVTDLSDWTVAFTQLAAT
jgi:hypothetical protein